MPTARVHQDAVIAGGSTIGAGAEIDAYATVDGSVIFDGATVGVGATITGNIVGAGAVIGAGTRVTDAVIGDVRPSVNRTSYFAGVRVWPDVTIADCAVRFSSDESEQPAVISTLFVVGALVTWCWWSSIC